MIVLANYMWIPFTISWSIIILVTGLHLFLTWWLDDKPKDDKPST